MDARAVGLQRFALWSMVVLTLAVAEYLAIPHMGQRLFVLTVALYTLVVTSDAFGGWSDRAVLHATFAVLAGVFTYGIAVRLGAHAPTLVQIAVWSTPLGAAALLALSASRSRSRVSSRGAFAALAGIAVPVAIALTYRGAIGAISVMLAFVYLAGCAIIGWMTARRARGMLPPIIPPVAGELAALQSLPPTPGSRDGIALRVGDRDHVLRR